MEYLGIIIGVLALIPVYFFIRDRFFRKGHKVDIEIKNTFFALFQCDEHKFNGAMGMGFYDMKITNTSNQPFTVKKVILKYQLDGKIYETDSFTINTGKLPDGCEAAILSNDIDNIILMGWFNLRAEIAKHQRLSQGQVMATSAYFILEANEEQFDRIEDIELVIYDYRDKKSSLKLKIQENWKDNVRKGFKILNRRFNVDTNSKINFV